MFVELGIGAALALVAGFIGFWLGVKRDNMQHERSFEQTARLEWNLATKPIRIKIAAVRLYDVYE